MKGSVISILLALFLLVFHSYCLATTKHALLIGINHYEGTGFDSLKGPMILIFLMMRSTSG